MATINEDFFKPGISSTSINDFARSPAHFWRRSSFNPDRVRINPTPQMLYGRLVHCLLLNPMDFETSFYVMPNIAEFGRPLISSEDIRDFLKKRGQPYSGKNKAELIKLAKECQPDVAIWDDIIEQHRHIAGRRDIVTRQDVQQAYIMRDAVHRNTDTMNILAEGLTEEPITWRREKNGILCKARVDCLNIGLVIDYKTTMDAREEEFNKEIANYGYHRELAWNAEAVYHLTGQRPRGAVIIAQEKEMPEAINVLALTASSFQIGEKECDDIYYKIKQGLETEGYEWPAYTTGIKAIGLPGYYKPTYERA